MKKDKFKKILKEILSSAGIKINGRNPWDIKVRHEKFYQRVLVQGSLGLGESYMDKWWDCQKIDQLFERIFIFQLEDKIKKNWALIFELLIAKIFNRQSKKRAFQVGEKHYNLGNELYENMLDKRMVYTCAYWKEARNLDHAQENKLDLVCRKLGLREGMKILDIGCGWGSFAKYAAEKYKVEVVGVTVSEEQVKLGKKLCRGLPVEIRLQDYRDINDKFDHVVSLGMFEHVGCKNYRIYMEVVERCLKDEGLFLLHTIGENKSRNFGEAWVDKYIFPNSMLPSIKQIGLSTEGLFVMEDWHNFSADYDKTLMAWYENFDKNWHKIKSNYDERFCRMWKYYLLISAGAFRSRNNQLWQIVFSKKGVRGGYKSIR